MSDGDCEEIWSGDPLTSTGDLLTLNVCGGCRDGDETIPCKLWAENLDAALKRAGLPNRRRLCPFGAKTALLPARTEFPLVS